MRANTARRGTGTAGGRSPRPVHQSYTPCQARMAWEAFRTTPSAVVGSYGVCVSRMRILFSAAGGHGHLQPLVPLALEALRSGHDVLVSAAPSLAGHLAGLKIPFVASGPDLRPVRSPLRLYSLDQEREALPRHFIGVLGPARARDLTRVGREWRPHLMVSDEADYGAFVAAELVGVPHATVIVCGAGGLATPKLIGAPLEALRATFHLPAGDGLRMLQRSLKLNPFPPSFRDPSDPLDVPVIDYRPGPIPPWPPVREALRVYVSLGTIFNTESGDLLARVTAAVAASPLVGKVLVATGEHVDPSELGSQSDKVDVQRFVAQRDVLAYCSAVVCHGGSGTVLDALGYGLPMVLLPLGADQPLNASRCHELGCGIVLSADKVTAGEITCAVETLLTGKSHSNAARSLQIELRHLPNINEAMDTVVRLATGSGPRGTSQVVT